MDHNGSSPGKVVMKGIAGRSTLVAAALCAGCALLEPADEGLMRVLAPSAKVELVRDNFAFAEGPLPTADGGLLFTDYRADRIWRLDPKGDLSVFRDKTNMANGLAFMPNGDLVAVEYKARRISVSAPDGRNVRDLTRGDGMRPLVGVNDAIADAKGGVYFTDPHDRPIVIGRKVFVYYLPPGQTRARVVDDTMIRPNGLALSPDGRMLYVADTVGHDVIAWDVQPDGSLANRRPFARLRGLKEGEDSGGDGVAVDRDGRLYVTSVPGVQVFSRRGEYLGTIRIPRRPTNVAFSGPGKQTLYITAREALYRIDTLVKGPDRLGK
jgi:gluconolactonase